MALTPVRTHLPRGIVDSGVDGAPTTVRQPWVAFTRLQSFCGRILIEHPTLMAGLLVGFVLLYYARTAWYGFVYWDDQANLYGNPLIQHPGIDSLVRFWRAPYYGLYIPVTYTVWLATAAISFAISGQSLRAESPAYLFHVLNVLLHGANTLLVYGLLCQLLRTPCERQSPRSAVTKRKKQPGTFSSAEECDPSMRVAALFGALLFALHPLQAEPVSWASGLKDLLSTAFAFGAMTLHLRWIGTNDQGGHEGSMRCYGAGLLMFGMALLAKPQAVAIPVLLVVVGVWHMRRPLKRVLIELAPWIALCVPVAFGTNALQPVQGPLLDTPLWARPLLALDSLYFYLQKLVLPLDLIPDYGRTPAVVMQNHTLYFTWIVPALLFWLSWYFRHKHRWIAVSLAMFAVPLLPVLGLIRFMFQYYSTVANHYAYAAFLGVAFLGANLYLRVPHRARWVAGALLLVLAPYTAVQVGYWRSTPALYAHALSVRPDSFSAHNNYGAFLLDQMQYEESLGHFRAAVALRPEDLPACDNLVTALLYVNKLPEAIETARKAVGPPGHPFFQPSGELGSRNDDSIARLYGRLGLALLFSGREPMASDALREGLRFSKGIVGSYVDIADNLLSQGAYQNAIAIAGLVQTAEPNHPGAQRIIDEATRRAARVQP
jgi:tetratricopeptide (TPR) repeat protein